MLRVFYPLLSFHAREISLLSLFTLSRFDLIFLMLDPQDELYDRRLASHLVSLYHLTEREAEEEFVVSSSAFF